MRFIFTFWFVIVVLSVSGQKEIGDTIFIARDTSGGDYHAVYIERNTNSDFYRVRTNFIFDVHDSLSYDESIKFLTERYHTKLRTFDLDKILPRQWCTLYSYKGKFYLYSPCDGIFNDNMQISDSTIIRYDADHAYAIPIEKYVRKNKSNFEFYTEATDTSGIKINMIDPKNEIAIVSMYGEYALMVSSSKAKNFPMIVNYCRERKWIEFSFEEIDFKKIISKGSVY